MKILSATINLEIQKNNISYNGDGISIGKIILENIYKLGNTIIAQRRDKENMYKSNSRFFNTWIFPLITRK